MLSMVHCMAQYCAMFYRRRMLLFSIVKHSMYNLSVPLVSRNSHPGALEIIARARSGLPQCCRSVRNDYPGPPWSMYARPCPVDTRAFEMAVRACSGVVRAHEWPLGYRLVLHALEDCARCYISKWCRRVSAQSFESLLHYTLVRMAFAWICM